MSLLLGVGTGDIHAHNAVERTISIFVMLIGVVSISFATAALSSILQSYDTSEAKLKEKFAILSEIKNDYNLAPDLYDELRIAIKNDHNTNYIDIKQFLEDLPHKLKIELALKIYQEIYIKIGFFYKKDKNFIAWIGPLLVPLYAQE